VLAAGLAFLRHAGRFQARRFEGFVAAAAPPPARHHQLVAFAHLPPQEAPQHMKALLIHRLFSYFEHTREKEKRFCRL
jgi:hypothetical protein